MTFLQKYEILKKSIPVPALSIDPGTKGCKNVEDVYKIENCYNCFHSALIKESMYSYFGLWGNKIVDSSAVIESEKCYQCTDCNKCHTCTYLSDSNNCNDCHFSAFLNSCTNCWGCVSLTHKKYCIFNKQYSKEEYFKKLSELKKIEPKKMLQKMFELKQTIPHPASQQFTTENCPYGNYIYSSKNCYWSFNSYYSENSGYMFESANMKNCWDTYWSGNPTIGTYSERCYEFVDSGTCYNCAYIVTCEGSANCYYCAHLINCSDCFGCIGLTNKKYCILNNQLTKTQYEKAVRDIKKELGWKV